jgi:isopentenyldiphosphate isomerase
MSELCQLYDERGIALQGKSATKDEIFKQGLLHGASHVWIWRLKGDSLEVLVQKRASDKRTWPDRYDISAAGHIDLGETPLDAALREAKEEINLDIEAKDLKLFGVHRAHLKAENEAIENEFQWLYSLELAEDTAFSLQPSEVASLIWMPIDSLQAECTTDKYVPHAKLYYDTVIRGIRLASSAPTANHKATSY